MRWVSVVLLGLWILLALVTTLGEASTQSIEKKEQGLFILQCNVLQDSALFAH